MPRPGTSAPTGRERSVLDRRPPWLLITIYAASVLLVAIAIGPMLWLVLGAFQPAGGDVGRPVARLMSGVEPADG